MKTTSGKYDCKAPNRILVIQDSTDRQDAKVFPAHAAPQGVCDNFTTVGDVEKSMESRKVEKPKFMTDFPQAEADELTLRAEEEGMLRTILTPRMWEREDGGATGRG